ncbi:MAG TPA: TetR/AcrR family transcriptional regulator [Ktedonosporobacter sp.]|nr:TetR/AcrR family transcriptional regulator [Ktedonosporobacter sp.]
MGPKQRRERERQATQQAILQAALEIASEEGWQAVTIRRVAERIEYSPSAIYKYFEDKEAILHALLLQGFQQMLETLERIAAQAPDPSVRLVQIAAAYWDFVWQHPTVYQLMFDLKGSVHEVKEAKDSFLVMRKTLEEWSEANEVRMADLDAAVDILWAIMHGMVALTMAQHIYGGEMRAKELLFQAVNTLLLAWKTPSHS